MSDVVGAATFRTPAEAYDRHIGRYGRELGRALIAAAGVRPGRRALDVGCGPGGLTASSSLFSVPNASRRSTRRRRSPRRAASAFPARTSARRADALPFADGAFDHALAQLVVNFMATRPRASARSRA